MEEKDYVLGYSLKEVDRLERQHDVVVKFSREGLKIAFHEIDPHKVFRVYLLLILYF